MFLDMIYFNLEADPIDDLDIVPVD